jgi:hypothetical protein
MTFYPLRLAGYGLLTIGVINLLFRGILSPDLLRSIPGRLAMANGLIAFVPWLLLSLALIFLQGNRARRSREQLPVQILHRLLMPLLVGYLLLVPLMIRDAVGYNRVVQSEIDGQLKLYRIGSSQLLNQVAPLSSPTAVARVVQRYPSISIAVDPKETAKQLKDKLAQALSNGEARLLTRLDDQRRSRLEGLFQRTIASTFVALVAAAALAGLRSQNLIAIRASGRRLGEYFGMDLLNEMALSMRQRSTLDPTDDDNPAFPKEWMVSAEPVQPIQPQPPLSPAARPSARSHSSG